MVWLLDYEDESWTDDGAMAAIGTIGALAPYKESREWRYSLFDDWPLEQRTAIAACVEALPRLVSSTGRTRQASSAPSVTTGAHGGILARLMSERIAPADASDQSSTAAVSTDSSRIRGR